MSHRSNHRHRRRRRRRPRRARARHRGAPQPTCAVPARSAGETRRARQGRRRSTCRSAHDRPPTSSAPAARPRGTGLVAGRLDRTPGVVDAAGSRGDRCQPSAVLQPRHGRADGRRPRRRSPPPGSSPSCGRRPRAASAARSTSASSTTIIAGIKHGSGSSTRRRHGPGSRQYPADALPKAKSVSNYEPLLDGMRHGIVVLYQKCPHLGCRVPQCVSSQWFECPCHGSQYNRVGEKKGGPAPRGMDRFQSRSAPTATSSIDTGTVVHRPADRHQHHRPGGRGPALHRRRRWPLMIALARPPQSAGSSSSSSSSAGSSTTSLNRRVGARSSAPRSSWRRTASRTTTTRRSRASASSASSSSACCCSSSIVIGLPLYWVLEPSRQAGAVSAQGGHASPAGVASCSRPTANGGFNCAGCHGGMKAVGGQAPYTVTDPKTGEVEAVNWYAPALNTVLLPLQRRRGAVHPQLRPPVLADVGVGHRRRRPDERPADQTIDRLPPQRSRSRRENCLAEPVPTDPAHRLRPEVCDGAPARSRAGQDREGGQRPPRSWSTPASTRRSTRRWARRCSTSTSTAAPTAAPAATRWAGATASPGVPRPGRLRLEPHRRRRRTPTSPARTT